MTTSTFTRRTQRALIISTILVSQNVLVLAMDLVKEGYTWTNNQNVAIPEATNWEYIFNLTGTPQCPPDDCSCLLYRDGCDYAGVVAPIDIIQRYILHNESAVIVCNQARKSTYCCDDSSVCNTSYEYYGDTYVFTVEEEAGGVAALFDVSSTDEPQCNLCIHEDKSLVTLEGSIAKLECDMGYGWLRVANASNLEKDRCEAPENSGSTLIVEPENGGSTLIVEAENGGSTLIVEPENGGSTLIVEPENGGSTLIVEPENGGSTLIVEPENGGSTLIVEPENVGSTLILQPEQGGSTLIQPEKGGSTLILNGEISAGSAYLSAKEIPQQNEEGTSAIKVGYSLSLQSTNHDTLHVGHEGYVVYSDECDNGCCTIKYKDSCNYPDGERIESSGSEQITAIVNETNAIICGKTCVWKTCTDSFTYFGTTMYYDIVQEQESIAVITGIESDNDVCDEMCMAENGDIVVSYTDNTTSCDIGSGWVKVKNYTLQNCPQLSSNGAISANQTSIESQPTVSVFVPGRPGSATTTAPTQFPSTPQEPSIAPVVTGGAEVAAYAPPPAPTTKSTSPRHMNSNLLMMFSLAMTVLLVV